MSHKDTGWPIASTANQAEALANLAKLEDDERDALGRFKTGNNGGGRPKGARNKLTDLLLNAVADDFSEFGRGALCTLRQDDPATYLRLVASLVPRGLLLQRELEPDFGDMSIGELEDKIREVRRNHSIQRTITRAKGEAS